MPKVTPKPEEKGRPFVIVVASILFFLASLEVFVQALIMNFLTELATGATELFSLPQPYNFFFNNPAIPNSTILFLSTLTTFFWAFLLFACAYGLWQRRNWGGAIAFLVGLIAVTTNGYALFVSMFGGPLPSAWHAFLGLLLFILSILSIRHLK